MTLKAIETRRGESGQYGFTAVFDIDGKVARVPVVCADLRHYYLFIDAVLLTTGRLWTLGQCEVRDSTTADFFWRMHVQQITIEAGKSGGSGKLN